MNLSSLKFFFIPFSIAYGSIVNIRNLFYSAGIFKKKRLKCPVISVGNITAGGTGKTPTVILIANELIRRKLKVGILTRGYGRKSNKTIIICNDEQKENSPLSAKETGDEPLLLFQKLPNTPIAISKNRYESGKILMEMYSLDLIILDDGFQHVKKKEEPTLPPLLGPDGLPLPALIGSDGAALPLPALPLPDASSALAQLKKEMDD